MVIWLGTVAVMSYFDLKKYFSYENERTLDADQGITFNEDSDSDWFVVVCIFQNVKKIKKYNFNILHMNKIK